MNTLRLSLCLLLCAAIATPALAQDTPPAAPARVDIKPIDPSYFIPDRHKGRTYLITGGARGIGAASAIRLAREGANVVILDVLATEGEATAAQIRGEGRQAVFVAGDVRRNEDIQAAVDLAVSRFGGLNGALNNAGIMAAIAPDEALDFPAQRHLMPSRIDEAGDEYFETLMDVNATGVFRSMRAELKQMLKQGKGGSIVNVCSIAGLTGLAGSSAYLASKHACSGLTRSGAVDYAPFGIRVNSVNMSATETAMTDMATQYVMAKGREGSAEDINMGRIKTLSLLAYADSNRRQSTVWEQAAVICFLLSDEASNLTGGLFATDGGWTAY